MAQKCHPAPLIVKDPEVAQELDYYAPVIPPVDGELTFETRERNGWRLSYRKVEPEKSKFEKYERRLFKKAQAYECVRDQLADGGEGSRHKTALELPAASDHSAAKQKRRCEANRELNNIKPRK